VDSRVCFHFANRASVLHATNLLLSGLCVLWLRNAAQVRPPTRREYTAVQPESIAYPSTRSGAPVAIL
jgi:hypothetical protein